MSARVEKSDSWETGGWFSFPRAFIRDPNLSAKAKGVAALLASHAASFSFSATELQRWFKDGRDAIQGALRELEAAGYLTRSRQSSGEVVYELRPEPEPENPVEADQVQPGIQAREFRTGFPGPENPVTYKDSTEFHHQRTPDEEEIPANAGASAQLSLVGPTPPAKDDEANLFEEWWRTWPKKVSKDQARRAYRSALRRTDAATLRSAAHEWSVAYAKLPLDERKFVKNPSTWLNAGAWDDPLPEPSRRAPKTYKPYKDAEVWTEETFAEEARIAKEGYHRTGGAQVGLGPGMDSGGSTW